MSREPVEVRSMSASGVLHSHREGEPCTPGCLVFPAVEQTTTFFHDPGCSCWHHQGGDYDRDCAACMALAAIEQGKPVA